MARQPQPIWRKQRNTWILRLNGEYHQLGPDKDEAWRQYHKIMAQHSDASGTLVRDIIQAYWTDAKRSLAESTIKRRRWVLRTFRDTCGHLDLDKLRPHHVTNWLHATYPKANSTTTNTVLGIVKVAINWAFAQGYIDRNPLATLKKPRPEVRQDFVPVERWPELLDACTDQCFRDLVTMILQTGIRVQEIKKLEAKHLDSKHRRFVFEIKESKGKRRSRVIYLSEIAWKTVQRLASQYPSGPLFRNTRGIAWDKNSLKCRFRGLKKKLDMPGLCATVLRHSFCHARLSTGQDALTVSVLMGHVDTRMVSTRYGHLSANPDFLSQAADHPVPWPGQCSA